jgi:hypothetical protein
MRALFPLLLSAGLALASLTAQAKTYTYDLRNITSGGPPVYPGLDLNGATAAVLNIYRAPGNPQVELRSLEISFPMAGKLRTGVFKQLDGQRYRALVGGAWVFKEVIVELDTPSGWVPGTQLHARVLVTDQVSFLNPEVQNQGVTLAHLQGELRDITYSPTIDSVSTLLDTKRVTLNLRDRLSAPLPGSTFVPLPREPSFVLDTLWMGRGQKLLYVPAFVPWMDMERIEPIGLVLEGPAADPQLRIRIRDLGIGLGQEVLLPGQPLRQLLQQQFGPAAP